MAPTLELRLEREPSGARATLGKLYAGREYLCDTLEDPVRERAGVPVAEWKIPGETACTAGRYRVLITESARFRRRLPLLMDTPGFRGVRIHAGNTSGAAPGCILVGKRIGPSTVVESRRAMLELYIRIEDAIESGGGAWISVRNA